MKNLIRFDWAIKRLLRNKASFGILEGFLSELLGEDIKINNVLESEGNQEAANNKTNRVDILVQNTKDELIIVEIQNNYMRDYLQRMLFGTSKLLNDHMIKGMEYRQLKKIISINIVYFDLGHGEDYLYHGTTSYIGMHKGDKLTLTATEEKLYHTVEIAKLYPEYYLIKVNQFNDVAENTLDEWINFFKNQEVKDNTKAKGLLQAKEELDEMQLTPDERREYLRYIEDWRDDMAEKVGNYEKGKVEGKLEGKIEVALTAIKDGMPVSVIAKLTGLSESEINDLQH